MLNMKSRVWKPEEVDVGEPTVVEDQRPDPQSAPQSVSQSVPIVGGSSGSATVAHQSALGNTIRCSS